MTETETTTPPGVTRWRKRPVTVEAVQWTGENFADVKEFTTGALGLGEVADGSLPLWVVKSSALCHVERGDWIIREPDGSGFYPCAGDVFAATYEAVGTPDDTVRVSAAELVAAGLVAQRAEEAAAMLGETLLRQEARARQAEAELAKIRTELEHAKSALAGDHEGIRLWMLDCGELVEKHREHADRAEAELAKAQAALDGPERNQDGPGESGAGEETPEATEAEIAALRAQLPSVLAAKLGRIRDLAESWTVDDGHGTPTLEMAVEAECGRQLLAVIAGDQP